MSLAWTERKRETASKPPRTRRACFRHAHWKRKGKKRSRKKREHEMKTPLTWLGETRIAKRLGLQPRVTGSDWRKKKGVPGGISGWVGRGWGARLKYLFFRIQKA